MLLLKFNPEDLKDCDNVQQIYSVFGIGSEPEDQIQWDDEAVFGRKANVKNIFCTKDIYDFVAENFKKNELIGKNNLTMKMDFKERQLQSEWALYSPTFTGPRYEAMEKKLRNLTLFEHLPDSMIAFFTPDDAGYEESPRLEF